MRAHVYDAQSGYSVKLSGDCESRPPCLKFYKDGELVFEISLVELAGILASIVSVAHSERGGGGGA